MTMEVLEQGIKITFTFNKEFSSSTASTNLYASLWFGLCLKVTSNRPILTNDPLVEKDWSLCDSTWQGQALIQHL